MAVERLEELREAVDSHRRPRQTGGFGRYQRQHIARYCGYGRELYLARDADQGCEGGGFVDEAHALRHRLTVGAAPRGESRLHLNRAG